MQFGITLSDFRTAEGPTTLSTTVAGTARMAEAIGAVWFGVLDHFLQMENVRDPRDPMLEAYTTLSFVAGRTERIKLTAFVTGVTYRHPGVLAKMLTTLDVLSGGRAMLAIGAAWYEREHRALGVPFPPVAERFERLEETLQIMLQMWSDDEGPYGGRHYQLAETINEPPTVQRPRPLIVVGGGGEMKTLRLVAQYADACNVPGREPEMVAHKLAVLRKHCDAVGRDYDSILKTVTSPSVHPLRERDRYLQLMEAYREIGVDHVQQAALSADPVAFVEDFGRQIVPRLADI
jgi:F420-dependent oxidoreductase-like protein